nr:FAD:protein FMN transferase [Rhodovulum steppense]
MGTRWQATFFAEPDFDPAPIRAALQAAVEEVDGQMSTWNAGSDLMRLNAAPVGEWVAVPAQLASVLRLGLEIGRASGGAFDIGMGDAVTAWGFTRTMRPSWRRCGETTPENRASGAGLATSDAPHGASGRGVVRRAHRAGRGHPVHRVRHRGHRDRGVRGACPRSLGHEPADGRDRRRNRSRACGTGRNVFRRRHLEPNFSSPGNGRPLRSGRSPRAHMDL